MVNMKLLFLELMFTLIILVGVFYYAFSRAWQASRRKKKFAHTQALKLEQLHKAERELIKENELLKGKLQSVTQDEVTKLPSWAMFEDRLNQNIKESERYQFTMAVLFVDVDNFKMLNTALGEEVGDALLLEIARRLEACIRQVDSIARKSKDTFVALLTQVNRPETVAIVVQRMLQSVAEPFHVLQYELSLTICIGVALYPADNKTAAGLLSEAEHALHLAKKAGNHSYQFYQEKMYAETQRELLLYSSFSRESIFNELTLYYQPIINMKSKKVVCMDALLYWQHPNFGLITPAELFNYADKQRKSNLIYEWMLRKACTQFVHWHALGHDLDLLGVQLPIKQLEHSQFIYRISQILQETGFKPECLLINIQESDTVVSFDVLEKIFNMLHYLNIKMAINNFGTGAFSLRYLKRFHFDFLKLDRLFIDDLVDNPQGRILVKSMLALASNMSTTMVAQGVESEAQIDLLHELGCSLMQGSLIGAPISSREVEDKIPII